MTESESVQTAAPAPAPAPHQGPGPEPIHPALSELTTFGAPPQSSQGE